MKLVIDISEEDYEKIKKTSFVENTETMLHQSLEDRKGTMMLFRVMDAIKNAKPLPKGHGRIIDESKIEVCEWVNELEEDYPKASTDAPTIIEADKEG